MSAVRRRDFIAGLGSAAAWPRAAHAQQRANPTIGYLGSVSYNADARIFTAAFLQGLKEGGYVEGQNVTIECRWAEGHADRLPALARDLIDRVAVIATYDTASSLVAKAGTTTIPIVFATGADPVKFGLVASLARPGGSVTGVTFLVNALGSKRLGLLRALVPAAATFGFLVDPSNPNSAPETADMRTAANLIGRKLVVLGASSANEIDVAFATFAEQRVDALVVAAHAFLGGESRQLVELALRHGLPTISYNREFAAAGGLMSYGGSLIESVRQQGIYTGRILKGDKPGDLPVQQVTRFEMVLNLKTAKALGLAIPPTLLAIADEVIE
jgi:putative tryptophan/tyrosine transport system substrate-binding protein